MSKPATQKKAPLEGFHPKQHEVKVVMSDGTSFQIETTWGKAGQTLNLDLDPKNHPAWQDKQQSYSASSGERASKFETKFGKFDFIGGDKK